MSGKRKRGRKATPQEREAGRSNLLAFRETNPRPAMRSGVFSTIASGEVPPDLPGGADIERQVSGVMVGFVADLGGEETITNAQRVILSGLRLSLLVQALVEESLKRDGIVDRKHRPSALLKTAATFINSARLGAIALGLDRRMKDPKTLEARLAEIAEQETPDDPAPPNGQPTNETEKSDA